VKDTQTYLNEVRERDNDETLKPQIEIAYEAWTKRVYEEDAMLSTQFAFRNGYRAGFYASYRTDVPKLLKMLERAIGTVELYSVANDDPNDPSLRAAKRCLSGIEQIARGCNCRETINGPVVCLKCREVTGDAEMDRNVLV
jgi:hypothetical protein